MSKPAKQRHNWDLYISLASLVVAVVSTIFALMSNAKAEKAILLSEEANEISEEANLLSQEANRIAGEANTLMETANRIQLQNTGRNVKSVGGPSAVAPSVWHCGLPSTEGIILVFDFGMDLVNSSERNISLIDMKVQTTGIDPVPSWNLHHFDDCGKREFIPVTIPPKEKENWYFIASTEEIVGNDSTVENLLNGILFRDPFFTGAQQRAVKIDLFFDDDSEITWEAPIAGIDMSYQYDYWSDQSCSTLADDIISSEAGQSTFDPTKDCK